MGATAMALALQNGAFIPLAFGGLSFVASDLILGSMPTLGERVPVRFSGGARGVSGL